jgi:uncharacterized protein
MNSESVAATLLTVFLRSQSVVVKRLRNRMNSGSLKLLAAIFLMASAVCSAEVKPDKLVSSARSQIGVTVSYDPAYRKLDYPRGDVAKNTGVCADVVVRALRDQGMDLQKEVHEDMEREFSQYPQKWGLRAPDSNIDHRRVLNLMTCFRRRGYVQAVSQKPQDYAAGDIVTWDLGKGVTHIGIVSDRRSSKGTPLILHNIGQGTREEDVLLEFHIIGHYRPK